MVECVFCCLESEGELKLNYLKGKKVVFIGNRSYVLDVLFNSGCDLIDIFCVKDSFLDNKLNEMNIEFKYLKTKNELVDALINLRFEYLISNGCPYILPISFIKKEMQKKGINCQFINVHTSLLPDCKGKHPVNAAMLFDRRHGVTCHFMDDGIDTGDIIEQIEIPITDDISLPLLYKLSFISEGKVFERALKNEFRTKKSIINNDDYIYYSRNDEDMQILEDDTIDTLVKKVKSFSVEGQYARMKINDSWIKFRNAKIIYNEYVSKLYNSEDDNSICCCYDRCILLKWKHSFVELELVNPNDLSLFY